MNATIEAWARDFILGAELTAKFTPTAPPECFAKSPEPLRIASPGRPTELRVAPRSRKTPRPGALAAKRARAGLAHTFLHHELQAAELCLWALLAFPETPESFRRGLLTVALDEVRHMGLYRNYLAGLGFAVGDFPVRDWFWERVPSCRTPLEFVALLGMGFEGANLDHCRVFAERFRAVGDEEGALLQERIGREEIAHVRFAAHWFGEWGGTDFDDWASRLPAPLTPILMRGTSLNREHRKKAGMTDDFIDRLEAWDSARSGS